MRLAAKGAGAALELTRRAQNIAEAMAAGPGPRRYAPEHSALRLRSYRTEMKGPCWSWPAVWS